MEDVGNQFPQANTFRFRRVPLCLPPSPRLRTALLAIAVGAATAGVMASGSWLIGRRLDPDLMFLDPRRSPTVNEAIYATAAEYALRSREHNDVLFIGDSTCTYGADPARFQPLTGMRAYNCGTLAWMGPKGFLVLLDGYMRYHPPPRLVVLTLSPFVMELNIVVKDPEAARRFIRTYAPQTGNAISLESMAFYAKQGATSVFLQGSDPRDLPIEGDENHTCRTFAELKAQGHGFIQLPGEHSTHLDHGDPPGSLIRDDWNAGVYEIVRACRGHGVSLLIQFTPIARAELICRDWRQLEYWVCDLEATQPGVTVARPIVLTYEPKFMWDGIHLNAAGVEKFMPVVAKNVEAVLGQ